MNDSVLIGLGHRMRSGKDTVAAEILKQYGKEFSIEVIPFAKALKFEVNALAEAAGGMESLFNPNRNFIMSKGYYVDFPEWVKFDSAAPMDDPYCPLGKQRTLLQFYGVMRRDQEEDYWVNKHREAVEKSKAAYVLVPDLRFPNELSYIKENGFAVRVDRSGLPEDSHASETALAGNFPWDYVLDNNGSLEELRETAVSLFDDIAVSFPYGYNEEYGFGV